MKAIKLMFLLGILALWSCEKAPDDYQDLVHPTVVEDPSLPSFQLSDGTLLHLETFGHPDSTLLLMLHGGPGGSYKGLTNLTVLSDRYFVVLFDQRGAGLSDRRNEDEELTPPQLVKDIHEVAAHFSPNEPFYLLGTSWGGALAAYYVQQHPDRVSKLVLAEPGALNKAAAEVANTTSFDFSTQGIHQLLNGADYLSFDNDNLADYRFMVTLKTNVGDFRDYANEEEAAAIDWHKRVGFRAGYFVNDWQGNFSGTYDFDFVSGISANYTGSTLILAGDKSDRLGYDFQAQYHQPYFPDAQLARIEGAGHFFLELNMPQVLPIVQSFLNQ